MRGKGIIYILSDGTGETASIMTKAALVHFRGNDVSVIRCKNVRTKEQAESILKEAEDNSGFVVHTIVSNEIRADIHKISLEKKVPCIDLLGPLLNSLDKYFEVSGDSHQAGLLRMVDEKYFKRIEAIEYTVKHDDGKELRDLNSADIILVGISRTSKTPLSIFLSHKGWKVANIPLVLGVPAPKEIFEVEQKKIVALTIDPDKLMKIRQNRLSKLGDNNSDYANLKHILDEIEYANELFEKNKRWPVFDVTSRALEETSSEIIRVISKRFGIKDDPT